MALTEISVAGASRANANLLRLKSFVNGLEGETVTLDDDSTVKTLKGLIADVLNQAIVDAKYDAEDDLLADLDWPADALGIGFDTLKVYRKAGASGAGSWSLASDLLAQFAGTASQAELNAVETIARFGLRQPPSPIAANASGAFVWEVNEDAASGSEPGSVFTGAGYIQHPTLGRKTFASDLLNTPFTGSYEPQYGVFWLVWSATDPDTRFSLTGSAKTNHAHLVTVYYDNGTLKATGGSTVGAADYVHAASDVALFFGTKTASAGIATLMQIFSTISSQGTGVTPGRAPTWFKPLPTMTGLIAGQAALPFLLKDYVQSGDVLFSGLSFSITVTPAGGDPVENPDWIEITDEKHVIFTPPSAGQGIYTVEADDGAGNVITASANYSAVVSAPDPGTPSVPPSWTGTLPGILALRVGSVTTVDLAALVTDGDTPKTNLTFTALSAIPGTKVNGSLWEVTPNLLGTYTQRIRVSDPQGNYADISREYTVSAYSHIITPVSVFDFF